MSNIGKIALRIIKWGLPIILGVLILLVALGAIFQERIVGWVVADLQKELAIPVRIEKITFSLVQNFPHASVIITNSVAHYPNSNEQDTLFAAERFYINLNLLSLIRGKLSIQSVEVNSAKISIITLADGSLPTFKLFKKENTGSTKTIFNIKFVGAKDVMIRYDNLASEIQQQLSIREFKFSGAISEQTAHGKVKMRVNSLHSNNNQQYNNLVTNSTLDILGEYNYGNEIRIDELLYNSNYLSVNGKYNLTLSNKLKGDFRFTATVPNKDLLGMLLKSDPNVRINALKKSSVSVTGKTIGPGITDILFEAKAEINGAKVTVLKEVEIDNIDSRITLAAQIKDNTILPKEITVEATELTVQEKKVIVSLKYLPQKHLLSATMTGDVSPTIFSKVFKISSPEISGENIYLNATLASNNFNISKIEPESLNFQGTVTLSNLSVVLPKFKLKNISGIISVSEMLDFKNLSLDGNLGQLIITGSIPHWQQSFLSVNNRLPLEIVGTLSSPYLNLNLPEWGISDTEKPSASGQGSDSTHTPLIISKIEVNFYAKKIAIRQLAGSDARGTLVYQPNSTFMLNNVSLTTFGGKANFNLENRLEKIGNTLNLSGKVQAIYVDSLFRAFNNFDLTVISHENLSGKIDADIVLKGIYENGSLMNKKLYCLTTLEITDGCLKNYQPLKKLSGFINLKELERINFKRLKNTIRIENDEIVIPEMFIENNALNINLSGVHKLSGSFDYRMKIKLNDLLWSKNKSANRFRSDLGIVEREETDGGSIFIKVTGTPENFKFAYDKDRAVETLGKRLKEEGTVLRNIFKHDQAPSQQNTGKKNSGFVISDPMDTKGKGPIADTTKPAQLKKNSGFKIVWE